MAKIFKTTEEIDYVTGEVRKQTVTRITGANEPSYIKLYLDDISYLHGLPKSASELMYELLNYITYGTNEIMLNSVAKRRITESIGIAVQTLDNRLGDLVKKGILDRVERGVFVMNPYLFGKGDWKTIKELRESNIHLQIEYDANTNERKIRGRIDEEHSV